MRVLGVDPGTRQLGYGVVSVQGNRIVLVTFGVLSPGRDRPIGERLKLLYDGLTQIVRDYAPDVMSLERVFYGKNIQSAIRIGEARAVAQLCAANAGIGVAEYAPMVVKKATVGLGSAHKSQVQLMVQRMLGLAEPPEPEDASDALAIAICHCHRASPLDRLARTASAAAPQSR